MQLDLSRGHDRPSLNSPLYNLVTYAQSKSIYQRTMILSPQSCYVVKQMQSFVSSVSTERGGDADVAGWSELDSHTHVVAL